MGNSPPERPASGSRSPAAACRPGGSGSGQAIHPRADHLRRLSPGLRHKDSAWAPGSSGGVEADPGLVGQAGHPLGPQHRRELAQHAWQPPGRHDRHPVGDHLAPGDLGIMDGQARARTTCRYCGPRWAFASSQPARRCWCWRNSRSRSGRSSSPAPWASGPTAASRRVSWRARDSCTCSQLTSSLPVSRTGPGRGSIPGPGGRWWHGPGPPRRFRSFLPRPSR
jgi:hypothetical protein